jgi:hypothetical protein
MPAALDDEIADHAVKERVGVLALAHIAQEVRDRERRALRIELDDELTHAGRDAHPRRIRGERGGEVQSEQVPPQASARGGISFSNSTASRDKLLGLSGFPYHGRQP